MEASLARFLESVDISQLEDRDQLLLSAKGGWIDAEGAVRIGSWVLASDTSRRLRTRTSGRSSLSV